MRVVVKIGSSSLTHVDGGIRLDAIRKVSAEVASARAEGHEVVLVTSAAISAGLPAMGFVGSRPKDPLTLQAAAAVGQSRLLRAYDDGLSAFGLVGGQVLLSPNDFFDRRQYLHARETLRRLLELGIVPIVNENDAVADDEIRFGDNDRIAALVAHAVGADLLVLLTDTAGLFTADPRTDAAASLVEEVVEIDAELEAGAGGSGSTLGSGGMASKLAAARMATWTGVRAVIASAERERVVLDAIAGVGAPGTTFHPRSVRLPARKLWIAFAMPSRGSVVVDSGARAAVLEGHGSLLAAGVAAVVGNFQRDEGVDIVDSDQRVVAKGVARLDADVVRAHAARQVDSTTAPGRVVVHRDDLVVLVHGG